jgi:hypothetical protein
MARKVARVISTMEQLDATKGDELEGGSGALEERERRVREIAQAAPETLIIAREIPKLERDLVKGARFYATMFGEVMGFDEAARKTMEQDFAEWLQGLQQEGLALVQRPRGKAPEWDARRNEATRQLFARLRATLPEPEKGRPRLESILSIPPDGDQGLYEFLTGGGQP